MSIGYTFLWNPSSSGDLILLKETEVAARVLGLQVQSLEIRSLEDFDSGFATATREVVHGLTMTLNPFINTYRPRILEFVAQIRLPAIFGVPDMVEAGGLMSYGPELRLSTFAESRPTWIRF